MFLPQKCKLTVVGKQCELCQMSASEKTVKKFEKKLCWSFFEEAKKLFLDIIPIQQFQENCCEIYLQCKLD